MERSLQVAITGGSGFIGSHVADRFLAAGHAVRVLDHARPHREDAAWHPADITDASQVAGATAGCDAILHLAAMANVNDVKAAPLASAELNLMGVAAVLEAARLNAIGHAVLASTVWVYEATDELDVDESTPLRPDGPKHLYTAEKIAGEMMFHSYAQLFGLPATVLRYGIPYGPRMREELVMPIFLKRALKGEPLTVAGDGLQYRNFIYVEDLADAHVRVVEQQAYGTFNLEGSREVAIIELAEAINARVPGNGGVVRTEARAGDYQGRRVSAKRAHDVLGWEPTTSFEEGLDRTVAWFKAKWAPQLAPA